jgi:hypothetical protein
VAALREIHRGAALGRVANGIGSRQLGKREMADVSRYYSETSPVLESRFLDVNRLVGQARRAGLTA